MSWLPLFSSFVVFVLLVRSFLWSALGFCVGLVGLRVRVPFLVGEVFVVRYRRPHAFFLFLLTEALAFGALFTTTLWYEDNLVDSISL